MGSMGLEVTSGVDDRRMAPDRRSANHEPTADPPDDWLVGELPTLEVRTLRVFTDETGAGGCLVAVVPDAAKLVPDAADRLRIVHRLSGLAAVFVEDAESARLCLLTPAGELPTAGHPLVGAAWLLGRTLGGHPETLRVPGGDVASWQEGGRIWIRGPLDPTAPWRQEQLPSAAAVTDLPPRTDPGELVQVWAWEDEASGHVRARAFGPRIGIPEVEASGSASMRLATTLSRSLTIRHGAGSVMLARPGPTGFADLGGFVVEDEVLSVAEDG